MTNDYSIKFAGTALGIMQLGIVVGALSFGILADKIGARNTAIFAMILGVVPIIIFLLVPQSPAMFIVGVTIFGFITSSLGTLGPLLTSSLFGIEGLCSNLLSSCNWSCSSRDRSITSIRFHVPINRFL